MYKYTLKNKTSDIKCTNSDRQRRHQIFKKPQKIDIKS